MEKAAMLASLFTLVLGLIREETRAEGALWLVVVVGLLGVAYFIRRKHRRIVGRRFDLPKKAFLEHELVRLAEEIRLDKLAMWLFLPPMAMFSLYIIRRDWSVAAMAGYWFGMALAAVVLYWIERRRVRKLEDVRAEVDRELHELLADQN